MGKEKSISQSKQQVDINMKLDNLHNSIARLSDVYDTKFLLDSLIAQVSQIDYFYRHIGENGCYSPKIRPQEGQIACFQLLVGFPKELEGRHWCYILKDLGCKMIVIPTCSVKAKSLNDGKVNQSPYSEYMDIVFDNNIKATVKMSYSDIRTVDVQRLDARKPFAKSLKTRKEIIQKLFQIIS